MISTKPTFEILCLDLMLLITCEIADFLLNQVEGSFTLKVQLLKQKPLPLLMFCGTRSLYMYMLFHLQNHSLVQAWITLFYRRERKSHVHTATKILNWDLDPGIFTQVHFFACLTTAFPCQSHSFLSYLEGLIQQVLTTQRISYLMLRHHTSGTDYLIHRCLNSHGASAISAPVNQGQTTSPITLCTEMVINCELSTLNRYFCLKIMFLHQSYRGSTPFIKIKSY